MSVLPLLEIMVSRPPPPLHLPQPCEDEGDGLLPPSAGPSKVATPRREAACRGCEGEDFEETLQAVKEQLAQLNQLVDVLSAQHEQAIAGGRGCQAAPPPGAVGDLEEEPITPLETVKPAATFEEETVAHMFQEAIEEEDAESLQRFLDSGADVNVRFRELTTAKGFSLLAGTPLILALIKRNNRLIRLLLQYSADPNAEYGFCAGAEQNPWYASAIHATMPGGNMEALKELIAASASLHASASNGANLVWQAAYFGRGAALRFLLDAGLDRECLARSQDDSSLRLTPLHVACKAGHVDAVAVLLEAKANFAVEDGTGVTPLHDAVMEGHADVVQVLVAAKADIFRPGPPPRTSFLMQAARSVDLVFQSKNHALMGAVAKGLGSAPELSSQFTRADLIRFLSAPGDAPTQIWDAVFRQVHFRTWEVRGGRLMRVATGSAFVDTKVGMSVTTGPNWRHVQNQFVSKTAISESLAEFRQRLTRERGRHGARDLLMPVTFYACNLPFIHEDLEVILAIADCTHEEIFAVPACKAIVELKWGQERLGAQCRMVMAFVEVMNLVFINVILNGESLQITQEHRHRLLGLATNLAFGVWVLVSLLEVAQAIGYFSHGLVRRYVLNLRYDFDFAVLFLTIMLITWSWTDDLFTMPAPGFRILLGFVVGLKWARFLVSLRQLKSVGLHILPIMDTMFDLGPFLFVLSVYFLGAVNMLYALGQHTVEDAFLLIYRLVVLGDVNLAELETGTALATFERLSSGLLQQVSSPATDYRMVVRGLMLVVSFLMGVSMMNLFVAMLCVSYGHAAERAELAFERSRAYIVLDQYAARKGIRSLFCVGRLERLFQRAKHGIQERDRDLPVAPIHSWAGGLRVRMNSSLCRDVVEQSAFVWFSKPVSPLPS